MTQVLEAESPDILDFYRDGAPVGRLGVPQDLSPMVCYLLSDAGSFTTGADMLITGEFHGFQTIGRCLLRFVQVAFMLVQVMPGTFEMLSHYCVISRLTVFSMSSSISLMLHHTIVMSWLGTRTNVTPGARRRPQPL